MEGELLGGRYRLGRQIGSGGMGVVREAVDETLQNRVAVKLLHEHADSSPQSVARLAREARAAAALGHPNIVRIMDMGTLDKGAYLVMELLQGVTLEEELDEKPLELKRAVRVHLQLLDALEAAHTAGVLHRDVKPANTFLTKLGDGTELVKLLDFGLAYLVEQTGSAKLTQTGITLGTPAYMSPERLYGERMDPRSDLYAVGVSLYESLTGDLPFIAESPVEIRRRILLDDVPDIRRERPEVGDGLAALIRRSLEKNPKHRFETAREMAEALAAAIEPVAGQDPSLTVRDIPAVPAAPADRTAIESAVTMRSAELPEEILSPPAPDPNEPPGPGTLPYGGVTVPPQGRPPQGRPPQPSAAPVTSQPHASRRKSSRSLMMGLALGGGLGALVLAGLGIAVAFRPAPASDPAPTSTATEVVDPPSPAAEEPAPVMPMGVEPPSEPLPMEPVAAPEPEPAAPPPRTDPPRTRRSPPVAIPVPQVRQLPPAPSVPTPPPVRPVRRVDPDQPLVPPGWE